MSKGIPKAIICYFDDRPTKVIERKECEQGEDEALFREFAHYFIARYRKYISECQRRGVELGTKLSEEAVDS